MLGCGLFTTMAMILSFLLNKGNILQQKLFQSYNFILLFLYYCTQWLNFKLSKYRKNEQNIIGIIIIL